MLTKIIELLKSGAFKKALLSEADQYSISLTEEAFVLTAFAPPNTPGGEAKKFEVRLDDDWDEKLARIAGKYIEILNG